MDSFKDLHARCVKTIESEDGFDELADVVGLLEDCAAGLKRAARIEEAAIGAVSYMGCLDGYPEPWLLALRAALAQPDDPARAALRGEG